MARNEHDEVVYPRKPEDISHLSASSLSLFDECPRSWATRYLLGRREEETSPALRIGSAHHTIIEKWFKQIDTSNDEAWSVIPNAERTKLADYIRIHCHSLYARGCQIIEVEGEHLVHWHPDAPPILLYLDLVYLIPEEKKIVIRDHKSNRRLESVEEWLKKWQPKIYAWAARQIWGSEYTIVFEVGYIQFGTVLEFEIPPAYDEQLLNDMLQHWKRMVAYGSSRASTVGVEFFPAIPNQGCRYCALKEACAEKLQEDASFLVLSEDLEAWELSNDPVQRYAQAHRIKAYAERIIEETKEAVTETVRQRGNELKVGESVFKLRVRKERSVDPAKVIPHITRYEGWESVVSFGLTKLDSFVKAYPDLKPVVEGATTVDETMTLSLTHPK